jgi:hypothetical protein
VYKGLHFRRGTFTILLFFVLTKKGKNLSITAITRNEFETLSSQLFLQGVGLNSVINDLVINGKDAEDLESALENLVVDLGDRISSAFCIGFSQFNLQEEWVQTCLKTLGAAREYLFDDGGLIFSPELFKLHLLQRCFCLLLNKHEDEAYKVFECIPQQEKNDVYSSMSDQLFTEPEELMLGQDHFYMNGIHSMTKVQALIASWKKASSSQQRYSTTACQSDG